MALITPPNIDPATFTKALAALVDIVGPEWVFTDPQAELSPYLDRMSPTPAELRIPSAAVAPANVEQTQQIVRLANRLKIPIWYYGTGKNFGYGGPAPRVNGYLVVDMKRMNQVLEVNEKMAYAVVEPGVSYIQLYQHLQEIGSDLWIDCAAPAWGGVIGNAMEHGAGYTPYGDHFVFQCGMEALLADGSLVRTGMGALPGSEASSLFKYGFGPHVDGMFSQGNFGIVTKMGIWLMPKPPAHKPFMISFDREADLHTIIERIRPLKVSMVYQNAVILEHLSYSVGVQRPRSDYWNEKSPLPNEVWEQARSDLDLGWWNMWGGLYGLPKNIDMQWDIIRNSFADIPGVQFFEEGDRSADDVGWNYRAKLMRGEPNMTEFNIVNWRGGGHINFTPIAPLYGDICVKATDMMREIMNRHGFDYITEYVAAFRGVIKLLMIMFDPRDEDERRRAYECSEEIILAAASIGFGELKAHVEFMDLVAGTYSGQDGGLGKTLQKIKDAVDPNGILAPGKSGIWPSSWQGQKPQLDADRSADIITGA